MPEIGPGSVLAQKLWRTGLVLQSKRSTNVMRFASKKSMSAFVVEDRPGTGRGASLELTFSRPNEDEVPKTAGDETLGQESSTTLYTDQVAIRYFKFDGAVVNTKYEQQHVSFPLKKKEVQRIGIQWAYLKEKVVIYQLAGVTHKNGEKDDALGGGNPIAAQDANHIIRVNDLATDEAVAADPTAILTTDIIDQLVMRAVSRRFVKWPMAPCDTPLGLELYVMLVGSEGFRQIKANSLDSDIYDLERAMIQGGVDPMKTMPLNGEGFIYNNTLVLRTDFDPKGVVSSDPTLEQNNTSRAVFFGERAGHFVYGEGFTNGDNIGYSEHLIHRRLSMLADSIYGFKRTVVDGESWGAFAVTHYVSQ